MRYFSIFCEDYIIFQANLTELINSISVICDINIDLQFYMDFVDRISIWIYMWFWNQYMNLFRMVTLMCSDFTKFGKRNNTRCLIFLWKLHYYLFKFNISGRLCPVYNSGIWMLRFGYSCDIYIDLQIDMDFIRRSQSWNLDSWRMTWHYR